jgi:hypothetical protein
MTSNTKWHRSSEVSGRAISGRRHAAACQLLRNNPENEALHLGTPYQRFPIKRAWLKAHAKPTMNGKFESTSKKYDESNLNRFLSVPGAR